MLDVNLESETFRTAQSNQTISGNVLPGVDYTPANSYHTSIPLAFPSQYMTVHVLTSAPRVTYQHNQKYQSYD